MPGEDPGSKVPNPPLRELCKKNQSYGECSKYVVRWYYDQTKKDCLPFVYSGCGGNENRFKSKQSCAGFCMQKGRKLLTFVDWFGYSVGLLCTCFSAGFVGCLVDSLVCMMAD